MAETSPQVSPEVLAARRRRRRYSARQDREEKVYPAVLNLGHIDKLIDAGLLAEHDALDRQKVAEAMIRAIEVLETSERKAASAPRARARRSARV